MKKKNFQHFPFFYGKDPLIYQQRDCASFNELASALSEKGHVNKGSILNYPVKGGMAPFSEDMPLPGTDDLIVITTRPPLDDNDLEDKKSIQRSGILLEKKLLNALRPHLTDCSRKDVYLNVHYRNEFRAGYGDRCQVEYTMFSQTMGCINYARYLTTITERNKLIPWNKKKGIRTAAYLIYLPEVWINGPDLLTCFSMTGSSSLIWSYLVRTKFSHLLDKPVISMVEIILDNNIPKQFVDFSFAFDWDVQIILESLPM